MGNCIRALYPCNMENNNELDPFLFFTVILGILTAEIEYTEEPKENECTQEYS